VRNEDGSYRFVHRSVMEWLVADEMAGQLRGTGSSEHLDVRSMSPLMLDFLCDLAGRETVLRWAATTLSAPDSTPVDAKNALAACIRLGGELPADLRGADLSDQDLTGRNLSGRDLRGADLGGMRLIGTRLAGADLRGADLSGAQLINADLTGARLEGGRWLRTALLGTRGIDGPLPADLADAAVAGRDEAVPVLAPYGVPTCIAYSPEGTLVAVGRGATVEITDAATLEPVTVIAGHAGTVWSVTYSPDGTHLATASHDGSARVWDAATGQPRLTITGHTDTVWSVAYSPDGTHLATASHDGSARIWDAATGQLRATLVSLAHDGYAVLLPDGSYKAGGRPGRPAVVGHQALPLHTRRARPVRTRHPAPPARRPHPPAPTPRMTATRPARMATSAVTTVRLRQRRRSAVSVAVTRRIGAGVVWSVRDQRRPPRCRSPVRQPRAGSTARRGTGLRSGPGVG
jgi:hypothetical protein